VPPPTTATVLSCRESAPATVIAQLQGAPATYAGRSHQA
jgi:hypothetical protein